jgi:hypothetical protein
VHANNFIGRLVTAAILVIDIDEVFDERIASAEVI